MIHAMLLTVVAAASAPPPKAPVKASRDPLTLDVVGVRLNMTAAQVRPALAAAGYRCREATYPSFDQQVQAELARRRGDYGYSPDGTGLGSMECVGPSGENLDVRFAQAREGSIVHGLNLYLPAGRVDVAAARARLAERFGRPTEGTLESGTWCGATCRPNNRRYSGPPFSVDAGSSVRVLGMRGDAAFEADQAAVRREADRLAPPARPSF